MSGSDQRSPALCLITNRRLTEVPMEVLAKKVLAAGASYVMLREKDLPSGDLLVLAGKLAGVTACCGGRLIVNSALEAAVEVGTWGLQLPFADFLWLRNDRRLERFKVGVSVHSLQEALTAENSGADYVLAGHIFPTSCKFGTPGRGLSFISDLKNKLSIPVWAVGGILPDNVRSVIQAGAEVVCVMSSLLQSDDPEKMTGDYLAAMT